MVNWSQHNSHHDPSPSSIPGPAAPRFGTSSTSIQGSTSRLPAHSTGRTYGYPTWYDRRANDTASGGGGGPPSATPSSIPMARSQAVRPAQTSSRRLTRTAKQPVSLLPAPTATPIRPSPGPLSFPGATAPVSSSARTSGSRSAPLTPSGHPRPTPAADSTSNRAVRLMPSRGANFLRASAAQAPQPRPTPERSSTLRAVEKATLKLGALAIGPPKARDSSHQPPGRANGTSGQSEGEHVPEEKRKTLQRRLPVRTVRKSTQPLVDLAPSIQLFAMPTVPDAHPPDHLTSDRALNVPVIIVDQHSPLVGQETRKSSASSAGPATPTESLGLTARIAIDARCQSTPDLVPSGRVEPAARPVPGRPFTRPVCPAPRVEPRNYDLSAFRVEYRCPAPPKPEVPCCPEPTVRSVVDLVPELTQRQHVQLAHANAPCPSQDQARVSRPRPQKVNPPHDPLATSRQVVVPLHRLLRVIAALSQRHELDSTAGCTAVLTVDEVEEAVEAFLAAERERVFRTGKWDAIARSRASWLLEQLEALVSNGSSRFYGCSVRG